MASGDGEDQGDGRAEDGTELALGKERDAGQTGVVITLVSQEEIVAAHEDLGKGEGAQRPATETRLPFMPHLREEAKIDSSKAKPQHGAPCEAIGTDNPDIAGVDETALESGWTFWHDKKTSDKQSTYMHMQSLRQLGTFNTVEGFYRHYSYMLSPSEFPRDRNVYCFREGSLPMWEEFPTGGCWIIRIKRKASLGVAARLWEHLLLACIGEAFEMQDVVGCSLATRMKDDAISVWNKSNRNKNTRFRIGEKLSELLELDSHALIQYKDNSQSLQDFSTYRNAKNYMFEQEAEDAPDDAGFMDFDAGGGGNCGDGQFGHGSFGDPLPLGHSDWRPAEASGLPLDHREPALWQQKLLDFREDDDIWETNFNSADLSHTEVDCPEMACERVLGALGFDLDPKAGLSAPLVSLAADPAKESSSMSAHAAVFEPRGALSADETLSAEALEFRPEGMYQ